MKFLRKIAPTVVNVVFVLCVMAEAWQAVAIIAWLAAIQLYSRLKQEIRESKNVQR